jgi:hypothetical protein
MHSCCMCSGCERHNRAAGRNATGCNPIYARAGRTPIVDPATRSSRTSRVRSPTGARMSSVCALWPDAAVTGSRGSDASRPRPRRRTNPRMGQAPPQPPAPPAWHGTLQAGADASIGIMGADNKCRGASIGRTKSEWQPVHRKRICETDAELPLVCAATWLGHYRRRCSRANELVVLDKTVGRPARVVAVFELCAGPDRLLAPAGAICRQSRGDRLCLANAEIRTLRPGADCAGPRTARQGDASRQWNHRIHGEVRSHAVGGAEALQTFDTGAQPGYCPIIDVPAYLIGEAKVTKPVERRAVTLPPRKDQ